MKSAIPTRVPRRALEAVGINFIAHVIGFDVSDPAALAQMRCLAKETGGTLRTASKAEVLAEAAPGPEPETMPGTSLIEVLRLKDEATAGQYEIRYILGGIRVVAGRISIEVVEVLASLKATDTAAGSHLAVTWQGPGYSNDYISVAEIGSRSNQCESYTNTPDGNLLIIKAPDLPGNYELRMS